MPTLNDLQQQYQETLDAISAIKKGGQEVQTRNGRYKMADLGLLMQEKADLERQIADADAQAANTSPYGGSFATPVAFFGKR